MIAISASSSHQHQRQHQHYFQQSTHPQRAGNHGINNSLHHPQFSAAVTSDMSSINCYPQKEVRGGGGGGSHQSPFTPRPGLVMVAANSSGYPQSSNSSVSQSITSFHNHPSRQHRTNATSFIQGGLDQSRVQVTSYQQTNGSFSSSTSPYIPPSSFVQKPMSNHHSHATALNQSLQQQQYSQVHQTIPSAAISRQYTGSNENGSYLKPQSSSSSFLRTLPSSNSMTRPNTSQQPSPSPATDTKQFECYQVQKNSHHSNIICSPQRPSTIQSAYSSTLPSKVSTTITPPPPRNFQDNQQQAQSVSSLIAQSLKVTLMNSPASSYNQSFTNSTAAAAAAYHSQQQSANDLSSKITILKGQKGNDTSGSTTKRHRQNIQMQQSPQALLHQLQLQQYSSNPQENTKQVSSVQPLPPSSSFSEIPETFNRPKQGQPPLSSSQLKLTPFIQSSMKSPPQRKFTTESTPPPPPQRPIMQSPPPPNNQSSYREYLHTQLNVDSVKTNHDARQRLAVNQQPYTRQPPPQPQLSSINDTFTSAFTKRLLSQQAQPLPPPPPPLPITSKIASEQSSSSIALRQWVAQATRIQHSMSKSTSDAAKDHEMLFHNLLSHTPPLNTAKSVLQSDTESQQNQQSSTSSANSLSLQQEATTATTTTPTAASNIFYAPRKSIGSSPYERTSPSRYATTQAAIDNNLCIKLQNLEGAASERKSDYNPTTFKADLSTKASNKGISSFTTAEQPKQETTASTTLSSSPTFHRQLGEESRDVLGLKKQLRDIIEPKPNTVNHHNNSTSNTPSTIQRNSSAGYQSTHTTSEAFRGGQAFNQATLNAAAGKLQPSLSGENKKQLLTSSSSFNGISADEKLRALTLERFVSVTSEGSQLSNKNHDLLLKKAMAMTPHSAKNQLNVAAAAVVAMTPTVATTKQAFEDNYKIINPSRMLLAQTNQCGAVTAANEPSKEKPVSIKYINEDIPEVVAETSRENSSLPPSAVSRNREYSDRDFYTLRRLGKGKHSEVSLAQDKKTGLLFAVKEIFKPDVIASDMGHQLSAEIRIQSTCSHPNILALYGFIQDEKYIYLIMEYAPCGDLSALIKGKKPLSETSAAYYLKQLADALTYLHGKGIVHRDIKPTNLLISNGVLKLCDFGYSNLCQAHAMRQTFCGTLDYLSPQIVKGESYGVETDVWSFGVLAFELLQGVVPFYQKSDEETMEKIMAGGIKFVHQISEEAKQFIHDIIVVSQSKRPSMKDIASHPWIVKNADIYSRQTQLKLEQ